MRQKKARNKETRAFFPRFLVIFQKADRNKKNDSEYAIRNDFHEEAKFVNKTELVASVAEKAGLTKKDAEKAINALFVSVEEALAADDKVQIIGFGTFEVKTREERKGRNPQTGAEITIPASKTPVFKAGKGLKDAVNK